MQKDVPNGTFRFEVILPEEETFTNQDAAVVRAVFSQDVFFDVGEGSSVEHLFRQPYEQGGGLIQLEKVTEAAYNEWMRERYAAFGVPYPHQEGYRFSGWMFTDWYTDSMTGVYESPVWFLTTPAGTAVYLLEP